jgi:hypothetical protein
MQKGLWGVLGALSCCALLSACGGGSSPGGSSSSGGTATAYSVGGSVSGLSSSGLTLSSGPGATLPVASGANSFELPNPFVSGASYTVSVAGQPAGFTCSVANGSGTVGAANVTNIQVTCTVNTYSLGGTVSALTAGTLVLSNGNDTVSIGAGVAVFEFPTNVAFGAQYAIAVRTQPTGLNCQVLNGSGTVSSAPVTNVAVVCAQWTWQNGSNTPNADGVYGTQGVAAAANVPGARSGASRWTDPAGNLWLFGGVGAGITVDGSAKVLSDLWEFSPSSAQWTWVGGPQTANNAGTYGTEGSPAPGNAPGARSGAATWVDTSGNLWLFGGSGNGNVAGTGDQGVQGDLDDLWEFNPRSGLWTWVGGSQSPSMGFPTSSNTMPTERVDAASWVDGAGNFWLFGGQVLVSFTGLALNDLWKYDPLANQWTLVNGTANNAVGGDFGIEGTAAASNIPPGRSQAASWTDRSGNLWLFGGTGTISDPAPVTPITGGPTDDLWHFNPSTGLWTWISGATGVEFSTVGSGINTPGAVVAGYATDPAGNFWLYDGTDLWQYRPAQSQWFWMSGILNGNLSGSYGNQGVAAPTNEPVTRFDSTLWVDSAGNVWLFGGESNSASEFGSLNDLWEFVPP